MSAPRATAAASRRAVLLGLSAMAAAALLPSSGAAHTPYGQWVVYRKKHLIVGSHRDDPAGYAAAKEIERLLVEHLPASRARVARAPAAPRLAGLLATDQLDLALLAPDEARAMADGSGAFAAYGPVPLGTLVLTREGHALLAHARFPSRHGRLVAAALIGTPLAPVAAQRAEPPCPWRPEAREALEAAAG